MTQYKQDGYVIVEGLLNEAEVELLKAEMKGICLGKYGNLKGLEPKSGESGEEAMARYLAIHFPHKLSERMRYFVTQHEPTCAVLSQLMERYVKFCSCVSTVVTYCELDTSESYVLNVTH